MERRPRLSVIIGVQGAWENVQLILRRIGLDDKDDLEVLICHALDDPIPDDLFIDHRILRIAGDESALIPELWALGIIDARAEIVAILSANCIPDDTWIHRIAELDMMKHVAYGGAIELPAGARGRDTAIHILRYADITPPQHARELKEVSADNAVYRRDDILKCADLLEFGFWEPSFHARFRARGLSMALDPLLLVSHANTYSTAAFFAQRFQHGREFGRERMVGSGSVKRITMLVLSPLAVSLFAAKVLTRAIRSDGLRSRIFSSLPWLLLFMAGWASGEIAGYFFGVSGSRLDKGSVRSRTGLNNESSAVSENSKQRTSNGRD